MTQQRIFGITCGLWLVALIALLSVTAARADWNKDEVITEIFWQVLHVVDWGQTRYIATHPNEYREMNPILGDHPSKREVDIYMACGAVLHPIIVGLLPRRTDILGFEFSPRGIFQKSSVAITGGLVGHNFYLGIGVEF